MNGPDIDSTRADSFLSKTHFFLTVEKDGEKVLNNDQISRYKNFQDKYDNYDPEIHERVLRESELVLLNQKNQN